MTANSSFFQGYLLMLLSVGLVWLRSSIGKVIGGKFVESLGVTLTKFASGNPYSWYKNYLEVVVIPNSQLVGMFVMWLEFAVALSITFSVVFLLLNPKGNRVAESVLLGGLLGGMLLNLNFWLASGWMSPSGDSLNLLMLVIQSIGFFYTLKLLAK